MATESEALGQRLLNGAKLMGTLWRSGVRCQAGWSRGCACDAPTKFCRAKRQWIGLVETDAARKSDLEGLDDLHWVIMAMKASELDATDIKVRIYFPDGIVIAMGRSAQVATLELASLAMDPAGSKSVLLALSVFPGSTVVPQSGTA